VSVANVDVIRWGRERVRTTPWRGDVSTAHLAPLPGAPMPSVAFLRHCLGLLAERGYRRVMTSALSPTEEITFFAAGFAVHERLELLAHDMRRLPAARPATLRRGRPADEEAVLAVDRASFTPFWQLDGPGLGDAIRATPRARYRVAVDDEARVIGYAITGRAGRRGYLQRLAVDPDQRRTGVATALVVDGLRWLKRRGVDRSVVNTQPQNQAALELYEHLGFRRQPVGLAVLTAGTA
jgi:ribosomal protein S18 acetylase RimI-like enzyme